MQIGVTSSDGPNTMGTMAMALVLAFTYVDKLSFFYIQAQLAQMSNVVALVFGQSWICSWWLAICGAHVKRWTLQLKF